MAGPGAVTTAGRRLRLAPTIRLRLTLLYGTVFLVTGAVLLTIGFLLVRTAFRTPPADRGRAQPRAAGQPRPTIC